MSAGESVELCEVGPRDGLQNERRIVPVEDKLRYIALLAAGALPDRVLGAVIADGPGLTGGPTEPISQAVVRLVEDRRPPDPSALLELGRDLRPVDYALDFVRMAVGGSELEEPIDVAAVFRPPWLEAVAAAPGVAGLDVPEALALYAR